MWIVMKGGLCHCVNADTGLKLQAQLAGQMAHTFILIKELGITINSSEIEGVYNADQYSDLIKLKQKMWHCEYNKWHKQKEECQCRVEIMRKRDEERKANQESEENRPLTDAEKENGRKHRAKIREDLVKLGILKSIK